MPGTDLEAGPRGNRVMSKLGVSQAASAAVASLVICTAGAPPAVAASPQLPCDIYQAAGTSCVAAYSTIRALYVGYRGPLYQVKRASDGATPDIGVLPSGCADAPAQDRFCAGMRCEITVVFDQSPGHNDLTMAGPGGNGGQNVGVVANELRVTVGGVYVSSSNVT